MHNSLSQRIKDAESLFEQGKLTQANASYLALLQEFPENPNILNNCGLLAHCTGNEKEAERLFLKALKIQKSHLSGLLNLADLYAEQERWEQVCQLLLESPFVQGEMNHEVLSRLGVAFYQQNQKDKAQKYLQLSFDLYPNEKVGKALLSLKRKTSVPQTTLNERDQYNTIYAQGGWNQEFRKHYSECIYYPAWRRVLAWIQEISNPSIIDIGCGPGQIANMLFDHFITNYRGIDYSSKAIAMAIENNPSHRHCFSVDDAYTTSLFRTPYSIALMLEILEHVKDDLYILQRIRNDTDVIFSVPNFPSATHVRWFSSLDSAASRYKSCINIEQAVTIRLPQSKNALYLFKGIKMNV